MEEKKKKMFIIGMSIFLILVLVIGGSYAWLTLSLRGTKMNVLKAGTLSLILDDENSMGINQEKAVPMLDEVGETLDPYHFTLINEGNDAVSYVIYFDDLELEENETRLSDDKIKYQLVKNEKKVMDLLSTIGSHPNRILDKGTIRGKTTISYDLRLWIDSNTGNEAMGAVFKGKLRIEAVQKENTNETDEECFVMDQETGVITDYLCYEGNTSDLPDITSVVIPEEIDGVSVRGIGERSFEGKKLASVVIPKSVTTIGAFAFSNNQLTSVTIPEEVVTIGNGAFTNNQLSDEEAFVYNPNVTRSVSETSLNSYGGAKRSNVVIPNGVKTLGVSSFQDCNITSVTIPSSVTTIKSASFSGNRLTSVVIPSSVTSIEATAFLKSAVSNPSLNKIDNQTGRSFNFSSITGGSSGSFVGGTVTHPNGSITVLKPANPNIVAVYQYNASSCVTGEESKCVNIGPQATYKAGTIIKYKVNANTEKYFHVMFDNGTTLTMQQRENTIGATKWHDKANNNKEGPLVVLPALESATSGWTNVNNQTYAMGTTIFKTNSFTGCYYTNSTTKDITCTANSYTLPTRTVKARMITAQEASALGCKYSTNQSCPNWMNNYLNLSTSYGGTVTGTDSGYWMMSACNANTYNGTIVNYLGSVAHDTVNSTKQGARAVVVIDK